MEASSWSVKSCDAQCHYRACTNCVFTRSTYTLLLSTDICLCKCARHSSELDPYWLNLIRKAA